MPFSISVVMATYNGAPYIELQLQSILCQLTDNDEVILVDDYSVDATLELVERIGDSRIQVFRNNANMGVQRSFERAIGLASGDIIFLSDQDDIWHPKKVSLFNRVFEELSDVTLVLSDARIIDYEGKEVIKSFFERRGGFVPGVVSNLIKNRYLGCVMAFRRVLVNRILPFPLFIPQHDMWIGLVNGIYGEAYFINQPLVEYRKHGTNASFASSNKRGSLVQMVSWRWALIKNLVIRIIQIGIRKH